MVAKILRILSVSLILVLLTNIRPALCDGWSLPNPFSSDKDKADAKKPVLKPAPKAVKKEPSTLDKVGADTKQFFTKVSDTLTFKKSEPKKASPWPYAPAKTASAPPPKKESWFGSWFQPEPPKKDRTVSEWLGKERLDP